MAVAAAADAIIEYCHGCCRFVWNVISIDVSMKLKELEGYLGQLTGFENPKILLEQYVTRSHIAGMLPKLYEVFYISHVMLT